jgi:glucose-6-phosphate isomerase
VSWAPVESEAARLRNARLALLFERDPERAKRFTIAAPHVTLDLSRQRWDAGAVEAFAELARERDLAGWRDRMFIGERVNTTEARAAWHVALRAPDPPRDVQDVRVRMQRLALEIAARPVAHILHIGIGGSDLGPRLVADALKPLRRANVTLRFASNVDGADLDDAIEGLDPAHTLVLVVSKTFTTLETLANASAARAWISASVAAKDVGRHFVAVTAAPERASAWGVARERIFPFWDWVGGRYSLWSAVGLSCKIALAEGVFDRLLSGAHEMDRHFRDAPFAENAPMMSACAQMWNREALGRGSYALAPYARRLELLPAYLQQLEMESNGKRVDREGRALARPAACVTWGAAGTNAQHSFFQMLHQGVEEIPVEFILVAKVGGPGRIALLANALAQAQALMLGKTEEAALQEMRDAGIDEAEARRLAPHRTFPGDRSSTLIGLDDISPESLGALLAFYEHRTIAQAFLADINPFDQYGVELGKEMAGKLTNALEGQSPPPDDPGTAAWVARLRV